MDRKGSEGRGNGARRARGEGMERGERGERECIEWSEGRENGARGARGERMDRKGREGRENASDRSTIGARARERARARAHQEHDQARAHAKRTSAHDTHRPNPRTTPPALRYPPSSLPALPPSLAPFLSRSLPSSLPCRHRPLPVSLSCLQERMSSRSSSPCLSVTTPLTMSSTHGMYLPQHPQRGEERAVRVVAGGQRRYELVRQHREG